MTICQLITRGHSISNKGINTGLELVVYIVALQRVSSVHLAGSRRWGFRGTRWPASYAVIAILCLDSDIGALLSVRRECVEKSESRVNHLTTCGSRATLVSDEHLIYNLP